MSHIQFYNEDCMVTMGDKSKLGGGVDLIITSPPYNTSAKAHKNPTDYELKNGDVRYETYVDHLTSDEYIQWTVSVFLKFAQILNPNGVVLWNMSYGNDKKSKSYGSGLLWLTLAGIIRQTEFTVADRITWKKPNAFPDNVSSNKLTRVTEDIFVICRKAEILTFNCNKQVSKIQEKTHQKFYIPIPNFIEAPNNDGSCILNKATFSSELVRQLLRIYAKPNNIVYDPFMGTGTTAIACEDFGLDCYGSELSEKQVEYSWDRLTIHRHQKKEGVKR